MKCSVEWLNEFVPLDGMSPQELAHALTMTGSKVETVTEYGSDISGVVAGRVVTIEKHPDADRLFVCSVDVGDSSPRQIITGATNVFAGAVVPAALDGALLPGGKKIKTGKMRGLESQGMLCSGSELGLDAHDQPGADADGILILSDAEYTLGEDITKTLRLRDTVLEFEITNNRPDCLSVTGLARETYATLAALKKQPQSVCGALFATEDTSVQKDSAEPGVYDYLTVTVEDKSLCPRYSARVAKNIKIEPSPMWMRRRLRACGVRPINNIVDITNYVMLETGQPMHAFDYACVKGKELVVRTARPGETLETLDGRVRSLEPSMLVIADAGDATAVAGVMGGAASEIKDSTSVIVFESANFNGPSVRKTALSLAMRTDASSRFEKGLDPNATVHALERACQLVEELCAGEVVPGLIDVCAPVNPPVTVTFTKEQVEKHLGVAIPNINTLLESLGFALTDAGNGKTVATVPSWRRDIALWQDICEEAARLFGYDNIPITLPASQNQGWLSLNQVKRAQLNALCASLGFSEMMSYSFIGPADLDAALVPADSELRKGFTLQNPLGEERSFMRTLMLPSLLEALKTNAAARNAEAWLFELGMVYLDEGGKLPHEARRLILGGYGGGMDYFLLKGVAETLIERFIRKKASFAKANDPAYHPGRCAEVLVDGKRLGIIGELHPSLRLQAGASACELDAEVLSELAEGYACYSPLPRFPAVSRDIALVCPVDLPASDIMSAIEKGGGNLLEDCALFDVYQGKNLPQGARSLAYRLTFRAQDRTLTDEEADGAIKKILGRLEHRFNISLRS